MKYKIEVEYMDDEKIQNRKYHEVLEFLKDLCEDGGEEDEKSGDLSSGIH